MHAEFVLMAIACICFFFAAVGLVYEPSRNVSSHIGWLGLLFFGLSFLVK